MTASDRGGSPEVSVIIAAYNSSATIAEQLAGLERQTFSGPWELIVADNGSTDSTPAIVAGWRDRIGHIRVVDASRRRGASFARNTGAQNARGILLAFCDADDVVLPDWLATLVDAASDADLVGGRRDVTRLNTEISRRWRGLDEGYPARFGAVPHAVGSNMLVRRAVFERLGGFDEALVGGGEDVDLGIRVVAAGGKLSFSDDAVILYRLKDTPAAVARQAYHYGRVEPQLFRKHRTRGFPRRPMLLVLKSWGWTVVYAWWLARPDARGRWCWIAGKNVGRFIGSVRAGVLCL